MIRIPGAEALSESFVRASAAGVSEHLEIVYGLQVRGMRRLDTEKDDTFIATTSDARYLVKVDSPFEEEGLADFLVFVMRTVSERDPGIPIQQVIASRDGHPVTVLQVEGGLRRVRVLSYLEGTPIGTRGVASSVLRELGRYQARIQIALRGVSHPGQDRHLSLMWEMKALPRLREVISEVPDPDLRVLMRDFLEHFESRVFPELIEQPAQIVHNDFNLSNILLTTSRAGITGILDFGDATWTQTVSDVAVTLSSILLMESGDAFEECSQFLEGYWELRGLSRAELDLLGDLVITRLVLTVLLEIWTSRMHPDNSDYLARFMHIAIPACLRALRQGGPQITAALTATLPATARAGENNTE